MTQEISLRRAFWIWGGSSMVTLVLFLASYTLYQRLVWAKKMDVQYQLQAIIQTGPEREALQTSYLAELLRLSSDQPISLYAIDLSQAEERLTSSPLIAKAKVQRIAPHTLYIDYTVRRPLALLADYQNVALDVERRLFPLTPFFTPKQLPEIYLGLPPFGDEADREGRVGGGWQRPLEGRHLQLALALLEFLSRPPWGETLHLQRIDVSNAFAKSLGQREIVLFLEEELEVGLGRIAIFPKILRLSPKEYPQQLARFDLLRKQMSADYRLQIEKNQLSGRFQPRVIDFRIAQLAFVQEGSVVP